MGYLRASSDPDQAIEGGLRTNEDPEIGWSADASSKVQTVIRRKLTTERNNGPSHRGRTAVRFGYVCKRTQTENRANCIQVVAVGRLGRQCEIAQERDILNTEFRI